MSWSKQKVVVPIDFSDNSFAALDQGFELVGNPKHLHAIHVLVDLSPSEPGVVWGVVDKASRVQHVKQAFAERLTNKTYADVNLEVRLGDAGSQITAFANEIAADLIVLPSHGRTGLKRILIGSVAERVVRLAHCPVLVLR